MGTYNAETLLREWSNREIDAEFAIGHLWQHVVLLNSRLVELEQQLASLSSEIQRQANTAVSSKPVQKRRKKT